MTAATPGLLELLFYLVCVLHKRPHSPTDTSAEEAMKDPSVGDCVNVPNPSHLSTSPGPHPHLYCVLV